MKQFLGIEIGGTKLQIVRGSGEFIHSRWKHSVDREAGAGGIRAAIAKGIRELTRDSPVDGIGVGFGGPVNWRTGTICKSHQIEGWSEFRISEWISAQSGVPVVVDNDANVAALAEATVGAGKTANPVFYMTLGSGVGGGLVVDRKIYHGSMPGEAEVGHLRLEKSGTTVESRCSGWALDREVRNAAEQHPGSELARLSAGVAGSETKCLAEAIGAADPRANEIFRELCDNLAFGLSHVVHLFHPEVIVIGGGVSHIGEPLRSGVAKALSGFTMAAFAPGPRIELTALREDAVPVGAVLLAEGAGSR